MKIFKSYILLGICLLTLVAERASAQYMPIVYDNSYDKGVTLTYGTTLSNGEIIMSGSKDGKAVITWLDRLGEVRISKTFTDGFAKIRKIVPLQNGKVLLVGYTDEKVKGAELKGSGRAMLLNSNGQVERDVRVGKPGTYFTDGVVLDNGSMILAGAEPVSADKCKGMICKVNSRNGVEYTFTPNVGAYCLSFDVMGTNKTEYVQAAFTGGSEGSCVVRLDEKGKPFYMTKISTDDSFNIEKMISNKDGFVIVSGSSNTSGGIVAKIRPEGDVVFQKQIVPASTNATMKYMLLGSGGEILVGGSGGAQGFYALLRYDGTELSYNVSAGEVKDIDMNLNSGESVISLYSNTKNAGSIVKLSSVGRKLYERSLAANYSNIRIDDLGCVTMGSAESGRLSMLSNFGEIMFDRFVEDNTPTRFNYSLYSLNSDIFFIGDANRIVKLGHGLHVSDITVNKPISGFATAVFTVNLSGYSTNPQGVPVPVTVKYTTKKRTANGDNFVPVEGTLSFIPSADGSERYLSKRIIEVPIKANDYFEGRREFDIELTDVTNSYLIKSSAVAGIEDQQAIVKLISTTDGLEGSRDVVYKLGIFKTNGVELTNRTGADVVIDGTYGNGTADALDFDMSIFPRLRIANGDKNGTFNVVTLSDTRYELPTTVVVDFNKIFAMSDASIAFQGSVLSCQGRIIDQPAQIMISSLGDHDRLNNSVSSFFKVNLVRASDGALLTNCSGGDIVVDASLDTTTTAKEGSDFVLTNRHDLRIWGDTRQSAVNLNGVVLFSNDKTPKTIGVKINGVSVATGANPLTFVPNKSTASFKIN